MKTLILALVSLIFTTYLYGQNFSKDYFDHCRPEFEKQPSEEERKSVNPLADSLMFAMTGRHIWENKTQQEKENTFNNILHYRKIMQLKAVDIDTLDSFILIEESNLGGDWTMATIKSGIIVLKDTFFSYSYDLADSNSLTLTNDFLVKYDSVIKNNPRSILFHLAIKNKTDQISALAVKEMNVTKPLEYCQLPTFSVHSKLALFNLGCIL